MTVAFAVAGYLLVVIVLGLFIYRFDVKHDPAVTACRSDFLMSFVMMLLWPVSFPLWVVFTIIRSWDNREQSKPQGPKLIDRLARACAPGEQVDR